MMGILRKNKLFAIALLFGAVFTVATIIPGRSAQAYHYSPKNAYETYAKTGVGTGLGQNPSCPANNTNNIGVTWLTDSVSSSNDAIYGFQRSDGSYNVINVAYGQQYRTVYIVGSIYACKVASSGNTAVEVRESGSNYLRNLSSDRLPRGSNVKGAFSDPPGYITAQLDTYAAGLANEPNAEVTVTVKIYRCFSYNSIQIYGWKEACGISYIPVILHRDAPPWTADATTEVTSNQAGQTDWRTGYNALQNIRPGRTLTWRHTITNTSDTAIPANALSAAIQQQSVSVNGPLGTWTTIENVNNISGAAHSTVYTTNRTYGVTQNDVDRRICQRIGWTPFSGTSESGTWGYSGEACATVPYHYPPGYNPNDPNDPGDPDNPGLENPGGVKLSASPSVDTVMPGEDVTFNYRIENPTGPTKTKDIEYRTYTFILPGGNDLPDNWDDMVTYNPSWSNVDCSNGGRDVYNKGYCAQGASGNTGNINPGSGNDYHGQYTIDGNYLGQPGDRICSYIAADNNWSVKNGTSSNSYAASNIACVRIGKKPQIQINGADSYAGQGYQGSELSTIDLNTNRNSYSQYGLLTGSSAPISNFGSAGYTTVNSTNRYRASTLAYANTNTSNLGNAGITHILSSPTKPSNTTTINSNTLNPSSLATGSNSYTRNGNLTINAGSLNPNTRATIYVTGDVTISGNISTYNDNASPSNNNATNETRSFTTAAAIPSLTIVATGNISVNPGVTLIDANLVSTGGTFISCAGSNSSTDLGINPSAKCTNKLKVNGSIISKNSPDLQRTYGSGNTNTSPSQWNSDITSTTSEWFNYTPNNWLTPYLGGGTSISGYDTVNVSSLPVRY